MLSKYSYLWTFSILKKGRMEEPRGIGEMPRQLIKHEMRGFYSESKIISKWVEIGDTSFGDLDLNDFNQRMFGYNDHHTTHLAMRIVSSGIVVVVGFPPSFQHLELIMKCTKHYNPRDITIKDSKKYILAYFSPLSISEVFGIPSHPRMVKKHRSRHLESTPLEFIYVRK